MRNSATHVTSAAAQVEKTMAQKGRAPDVGGASPFSGEDMGGVQGPTLGGAGRHTLTKAHAVDEATNVPPALGAET